MNNFPKTVWILGAGFSRSLGGPLLTDLFSSASTAVVRARFPEFPLLNDDNANAAQNMYRLGQEKGTWRDAEDYLEWLDAAATGSSAALARMHKAFERYENELRIKDVFDAARRQVAIECAEFSLGDLGKNGSRDVVQTERWEPYQAWAGSLDWRSDVLVTFNYDRALEQVQRSQMPFLAMLPHELQETRSQYGYVPLLKLHGSVDWRRIKEGSALVRFEHAGNGFALDAPGAELAIGTPGGTKASITDELELLWEFALNRIRVATHVVFIGYRFPESDARSRARLLQAVSDNESRFLRLHVVLGADIGHRDVVRMQHLLRFAALRGKRREVLSRDEGTFSVRVYPMYAEDFLAVYSPEALALDVFA